MATAVPAGASSRGGTSTCRSGHLLPPPRTGEPTATSRVSRGSSSRRSEASEGAARGTDDAEGMGKKMVPAADDMGGRVGCYRGLSSSSYGSRAAPLTRDHPASPPVSSRRGGNGRKTRGGSDASSFVRPRPNDEQERLSTRAIFLQQPSVPLNIRPQAARHALLPDRRVEVGNQVPSFFHSHYQHVGADYANCEERSPKVGAKKIQEERAENSVTSANYLKPSPLLEKTGIHDVKEWRLPKVGEKEDEKGYAKCNHGTLEDSNHSADLQKPSLFQGTIRFTLQKPRPRPRLSYDFSKEGSQEYSSAAASSGGSSKKEHARESLKGRVGYGDPHPPPFFKCQVCTKRTAFYRLRCCDLVVCQLCGCKCDPDDMEASRKPQFAEREELPKVKLEGSNLFLWQNFNFPLDLMLCKAKRDGDILEYYFASVGDLMRGGHKAIQAKVYRFILNGIKVRSWTVSDVMF